MQALFPPPSTRAHLDSAPDHAWTCHQHLTNTNPWNPLLRNCYCNFLDFNQLKSQGIGG